ncbi:transferrin-binding protein-like solute binding protein [Neisseria sp.]|uniref:transferrin-binding protein-like solute binding protein n=1 Tax=Neisseria sp. TaxID=192066 RepID=UPI0026DD20AC|nr:transferrin-binding protein-like solute binding protein [Neisseria sp.]MDO4906728.1 transferrin-binding protein-like solute binding protein [Neisseria sp.]
MKNYLTLACLLVLAACGGGGGASPDTQSTPIGSNTAAPSAPAAQTAGRQYYSWRNTAADAVTFDAADIKKLKIDGVEINLAEVGGGSFNNSWRGNFGGIRSGSANAPAGVSDWLVYNQSDNLAAGVITKGGNNFAFYNGKFTDTAQIPASGQAVYNAGVVQFNGLGSQTLGSTLITADFGAKTVSGNISRDAAYGGDIALNAGISGNKFASADGSATQVEGGFFGAGAAEIGGIFKAGDTVGAFAGRK